MWHIWVTLSGVWSKAGSFQFLNVVLRSLIVEVLFNVGLYCHNLPHVLIFLGGFSRDSLHSWFKGMWFQCFWCSGAILTVSTSSFMTSRIWRRKQSWSWSPRLPLIFRGSQQQEPSPHRNCCTSAAFLTSAVNITAGQFQDFIGSSRIWCGYFF